MRYDKEIYEYEQQKIAEEMHYEELRYQYAGDMQDQFDREFMFAMDMVYNEEVYEKD